MAQKRLFSGIQPSGDIHLGNYLGAIRNWANLIDDYECFFCIVDYHAITVDYDPAGMPDRVMKALAINISAGLDPADCTIFVQSHVSEHMELAWILNSVISIGHLERMTQFKEKSKQHRSGANVGLFTYPVLQAADILLYKGEVVPVGEDQVQHIELAREIARKFNNRFGDIFPEPRELLSDVPRIMGVDGKAKMSKSLNNYISLLDPPETIWKKLAGAVTDENRKRRNDPGNPDICNIFTMHKGFSSQGELDYVIDGCRNAGIGCVDCKKMLHKNMVSKLGPIRDESLDILKDHEYMYCILEDGARRCAEIAAETMDMVRSSMGICVSV